MANMVKYDADRLSIVKENIKKKNDELLDAINKALAYNDNSTYNHLKQLQLQCQAQLRFITLLENNFEDDNYIIC